MQILPNKINDNKVFDEWIEVKKELNSTQKYPHITEGEVWWCGIGKNVGVEINGKSEKFSRPVLVFRKLSSTGFLAIPLSTQIHNGSWYAQFTFRGIKQVAALSQIRVTSVFRLYERIGELSKNDFALVKDGFKKLYIAK